MPCITFHLYSCQSRIRIRIERYLVNGDWNRDKTRDEIDPNQKLCESSPLNKAKKVRHPFNSDRNDGKNSETSFNTSPKNLAMPSMLQVPRAQTDKHGGKRSHLESITYQVLASRFRIDDAVQPKIAVHPEN